MPINKRIPNTVPSDEDDNVIAMDERANDARGVFDPSKDPYDNSMVGSLGDSSTAIGSALAALGDMAMQENRVPSPTDMPVQELLAIVRSGRNGDAIENRYRKRVNSPLSGIRAWCVTQCKSNAVKSVNQCSNVSCPLWPFRMGTNGMRGVK